MVLYHFLPGHRMPPVLSLMPFQLHVSLFLILYIFLKLPLHDFECQAGIFKGPHWLLIPRIRADEEEGSLLSLSLVKEQEERDFSLSWGGKAAWSLTPRFWVTYHQSRLTRLASSCPWERHLFLFLDQLPRSEYTHGDFTLDTDGMHQGWRRVVSIHHPSNFAPHVLIQTPPWHSYIVTAALKHGSSRSME